MIVVVRNDDNNDNKKMKKRKRKILLSEQLNRREIKANTNVNDLWSELFFIHFIIKNKRVYYICIYYIHQ